MINQEDNGLLENRQISTRIKHLSNWKTLRALITRKRRIRRTVSCNRVTAQTSSAPPRPPPRPRRRCLKNANKEGKEWATPRQVDHGGDRAPDQKPSTEGDDRRQKESGAVLRQSPPSKAAPTMQRRREKWNRPAGVGPLPAREKSWREQQDAIDGGGDAEFRKALMDQLGLETANMGRPFP